MSVLFDSCYRCATQWSTKPARQACPLLLAPEMPDRLLGHLPRAKKFIGGHISPCPFSTCPSDRSPFVERRFQFASRRFFVINLQTAQRRNAKSKREKEEGTGGGREMQGDTMLGINERVNKSKEGRASERADEEGKGRDRERGWEGRAKTGARRPVCRGVSAFCGRQMTVAYLPEPAAILLRSELRRRPNARRGKKKWKKDIWKKKESGLKRGDEYGLG